MENKKVNGIRDLADILGVSATIVSRVLNGMAEKYRIREATKNRVIEYE